MTLQRANRLKSLVRIACAVVMVTLAQGCAQNKPKPGEIFLMPAPGVYEEGRIDPFIDNDPISRGLQPGILYATDRAKAAPDDKHFKYYNYDRAGMVYLGVADVRVGHDESITWEEARRISLLKNRTENYPLAVADVREFGVLESTVSPTDDVTERSPEPGRRFFAEIDQRLAVSKTRDVYIYVHGYKVNFENPILVASELWHFLGYNGAFIAYSWPTKPSTFAYFADLDNAINSARYLRTLILEIAKNTRVNRIHVIGYSAGTRLVGRMLADLGMYGYLLGDDEVDRRVKLGNVILIGSDIDQDILTGYLFDGALRIPEAFTIYVSQADNALKWSNRVFRGHARVGQLLDRRELNAREKAFFEEHPEIRIIDVTNAEGSTTGNGHGYFRSSPWVSSDVLMTLMYNLKPRERGLVREDDWPVWDFPPDYVERLRESLVKVNPALRSEPPPASSGDDASGDSR